MAAAEELNEAAQDDRPEVVEQLAKDLSSLKLVRQGTLPITNEHQFSTEVGNALQRLLKS